MNSTNLNRRLKEVSSEHEKEKALMDQKIKFLEESIADMQRREEEYSFEIKKEKKEHQSEARELQGKYEE